MAGGGASPPRLRGAGCRTARASPTADGLGGATTAAAAGCAAAVAAAAAAAACVGLGDSGRSVRRRSSRSRVIRSWSRSSSDEGPGRAPLPLEHCEPTASAVSFQQVVLAPLPLARYVRCNCTQAEVKITPIQKVYLISCARPLVPTASPSTRGACLMAADQAPRAAPSQVDVHPREATFQRRDAKTPPKHHAAS